MIKYEVKFDEGIDGDYGDFYLELDVEAWTVNEILHRIDGPALVGRDKAGNVIAQEWFQNGRLHRVDGPAQIFKMPDGEERRWYLSGDLHRDSAPAILVVSRETGAVLFEEWY